MSDKTTFDKIYDGCEELVKKMKKPLVQRQAKRALEAAHDSAAKVIDDAEARLIEFREKLVQGKADVNDIIEAKDDINAAKATQTMIEDEYEELFGTKLTIR